MTMARAASRSPSDNPFSWLGTRVLWWVCVVLASALFLQSAKQGGITWDESIDFLGAKDQLAYARNLLLGHGEIYKDGFRSIHHNLEFYGIGTSLPAYAASYFIDAVWRGQAHTYDKSFSLILHLIAFVCGIGASWYVGRLVLLATGQNEVSLLASVALLLTPVWIGYSFFNYKDVPVAAGVIAVVYYAVCFIKEPRALLGVFFFGALLFLGAQKLATLVLALPACIGVALAVIEHRSMRLAGAIAVLAVAFVVLLYLVTPPSWQEPVTFLRSNLAYMSLHQWNWCTLTAGDCIGRFYNDGAGYSAAKYLSLWHAVQLPVLLQIGLFAAGIRYLRFFGQSTSIEHLTFASLAWPVGALVIRDSTLYDGIRHTLFLLPLAVSFVFIMIPGSFWLQWRLLLLAYLAFLLIDTVRLQPYSYVWFNEFARFFANERNYETDYWGYSLREAGGLAQNHRRHNEWIVGHPPDLVAPFVAPPHATRVEGVPYGENYLFVRFTRGIATAPAGCETLQYVTRHQLLAPQPLRFSFVARCRSAD